MHVVGTKFMKYINNITFDKNNLSENKCLNIKGIDTTNITHETNILVFVEDSKKPI